MSRHNTSTSTTRRPILESIQRESRDEVLLRESFHYDRPLGAILSLAVVTGSVLALLSPTWGVVAGGTCILLASAAYCSNQLARRVLRQRVVDGLSSAHREVYSNSARLAEYLRNVETRAGNLRFTVSDSRTGHLLALHTIADHLAAIESNIAAALVEPTPPRLFHALSLLRGSISVPHGGHSGENRISVFRIYELPARVVSLVERLEARLAELGHRNPGHGSVIQMSWNDDHERQAG